jgi:Spy/CpxP family protein refolding chaperone
MKWNLAIMLVLSYLCMLLATSAYAAVDSFVPASNTGGNQMGPQGRGQGDGARVLKEKLGLTDVQVEQLKSFREKHKAERQAQMDSAKSRVKAILSPDQQALWERNMGEMKAAGQGNRGRMKSMMQEMGLSDSQKTQIRSIMEEERGKMQAQRQTVQNELKTILTPDQFSKFEEMRKARMERGGRSGEGRRGNSQRRGNRGGALPAGEGSE